MAGKESSSKARTRHSSSTRLSDYLGGTGKEFLPSEVPTLRDVLQKGLLIQECKMLEGGGGRKNYPVREMIEELVTAVYLQWEKSSSMFKPPVVSDKKALVQRVKRLWEKATAIALKKETKEAVVSSFESKLDRLFDITVCQCTITLCNEGCIKEAHIFCTCMKDKKVPLLELSWLKSQREKTGSKSNLQMVTEDKKETEKQQRYEERKQRESESREKQIEKNIMEEEKLLRQVEIADNYEDSLENVDSDSEEEDLEAQKEMEVEENSEVQEELLLVESSEDLMETPNNTEDTLNTEDRRRKNYIHSWGIFEIWGLINCNCCHLLWFSG